MKTGPSHICFFSHPSSVSLLRRFHAALQFDCTYKTNKFGQPLLVCTGLTPSYKSFLGCLILLRREEKADYEWALSAVQRLVQNTSDPHVIVSDNEAALLYAVIRVFPLANRIICRWHVSKNIVRKCKKYFSDGAQFECLLEVWQGTCSQRSEEAFGSYWADLKSEFKDYPDMVNYLESTWLKHKEKIADAWVSKLLHFGCSTTSRAESSNSFLKKFLSSSVGDLLTVFQETKLAIEHQIYELQKSHADDAFKRPVFIADSIYSDVANKISSYALQRVHSQYQNHNGEQCTRPFSTTMGLPCAHLLAQRKESNQSLQLSDFNLQWHLHPVLEDETSDDDDLTPANLINPIPTLQMYYDAASTHTKIELIEQF